MLLFDSLAYVQVTLMLFIAAALGLKTLALADADAPAWRNRAARHRQSGSLNRRQRVS